MPILATYGQFTTYVDANGRYRVWFEFPDGQVMQGKFDVYITDAEVEWQMFVKRRRMEFPVYPKLPFDSDNDKTIIVNAVQHIRNSPALTLTQWNTYLNTLTWYNRYLVRGFLFRLAQGVAAYYGVNLGTMTETAVLQAVRNWICNTNINIVQAVIFDRLNVIT